MGFFFSVMTMFILQKTVNLTPNVLAVEKLLFVGKSLDHDQHQFRWRIGIFPPHYCPELYNAILFVYIPLNEGNENVSSLAKVNGGVKKRINISF